MKALFGCICVMEYVSNYRKAYQELTTGMIPRTLSQNRLEGWFSMNNPG